MKNKGLIALSPLGVFVILYLVTSIVAGDFYKVPITVAFMVSSIYAIVIAKDKPLKERVDIFSRGAGSSQMMLMIWIFLLAGAFAHSAKMMGSIDATVNLTLHLLPSQMLLAGLFLAACFISISIGTRHERWHHRCANTNCRWRSPTNRYGHCSHDSRCRRRIVLWRQSLIYLGYHNRSYLYTRLQIE